MIVHIENSNETVICKNRSKCLGFYLNITVYVWTLLELKHSHHLIADNIMSVVGVVSEL